MENLMHTDDQQIDNTPKRPQFLTVICVLSFIWSGIIILGLILCLCLSSLIFNTITGIVTGTMEVPTINEEQKYAMSRLMDLGQGTFAAIIAGAIIIYMTSLLGVVKMWRLQKWGFYIYAGINGLGLVYDIYSGSYFMALITAAFIAMYYANFKFMK